MLTPALKPLKRRGLVRVEPSPTDGRALLLLLTNAGRERLAAAVPIWRDTHMEIERRLDGLYPNTLRRALILLFSG